MTLLYSDYGENVRVLLNNLTIPYHTQSNSIKLITCGTDGWLLLSGFQALVTLTLTLDRVTGYTVVHHSSTSVYTPKFHWNRKNFRGGLKCPSVGMYVRTYLSPSTKSFSDFNEIWQSIFLRSCKTKIKRETKTRREPASYNNSLIYNTCSVEEISKQ